MSRVLLSIVARELRVASRRRGTFWGRSAIALAALAAAAWVFLVDWRAPVARTGQDLFIALLWVLAIYSLTVGIRHTAERVSEERREGTLGLLFLTDSRGLDVVLGKLASATIHSLYGLVATLPVLAIPFLTGGVGPRQYLRVALTLIVCLMYSLTLGLWMSTWFTRERRAAVATALWILFISIGPVGLMFLDAITRNRSQPRFGLCACSPTLALLLAADPMGAPPAVARLFGPSLFCMAGQALVFIFWAAHRVRRLARSDPVTGLGRVLGNLKHRWSHGGPAAQRFRRRRLDLNPFFWLAARDRLKPLYVWTFVAVYAAGWTALFTLVHPLWREMGTGAYIMMIIGLHVPLKVWIGFAATGRVAEDRGSGALELLLSTPLSLAEIRAGHMRALYRQFGAVLLLVLLVNMTFNRLAMQQSYSGDDTTLVFFISHSGMLIADFYALAWGGLWAAVRSRNTTAAAGSVFGRVLLLPWLILGVLAALLALYRQVSGPAWTPFPKEATLILLWLVVGLGVDLMIILQAKAQLLTRFRSTAAEWCAPRPRGWLSWFQTRPVP